MYPIDFLQKNQISNFMKKRPVGTELFHTDRHNEVNNRFSRFCEGAQKNHIVCLIHVHLKVEQKGSFSCRVNKSIFSRA